jgi:antitoxin ParD1/3/4
MQVSLTSTSDEIIQQMMALGYGDTPASLIEVALQRMAQEELVEPEDESPEYLEWVRREVSIGAEQLERGEFSTRSVDDIKAAVLAEYRNYGTSA